jgi:manganese-dependent inorganic pyrophosphatase
MAKEKPIYVVGHKKPDTDSICAAIAYARYLNQKGEKAVAARSGELNEETKFILKKFKEKSPKLLSSARGKALVLVDHNEEPQNPDDIDEAEIVEVIDHHKINFKSENPIYFHSEPIGATASIVAKLYLYDKDAKLTKGTAGILLSAILSDTVIFRSPTTTEQDVEIAGRLAKIAGVKNVEKFGLDIKKTKASLKGKSAEKIIMADSKEYKFGRKQIAVGQVEVCGMDEVKERKEELIDGLKRLAAKKKYDLIMLMATDILAMGSQILFWGEEKYVEKAFGKKPKGHTLYLKGVMSRKKQIVPPLTKVLSK